jgi:polysaccharide biosynthesis transport protein
LTERDLNAENNNMRDRSMGMAPPEGVGSKAGESGGSIVTMAEVTALLRRWWWQCSLAGLVCAAGAAGAVWATFTPVYEAMALLLIKSNPDFIAFPEQAGGYSYAATQLETLRSPIVLSRVASKPEVANQPEAKSLGDVDRWLAKFLGVGFIGQSDLCRISFRAQNPQLAATVVNAIVDEYLALHQENHSEQTERIINLLVDHQRERQQEVERMRLNVRTMTKRTTGHEPLMIQEGNVVVHNPLAEIEQRRVTAEVEYNVSMAHLKAHQDAAAENKVEIPPEELQRALYEHPEVKQLVFRVAELDQQHSKYKTTANPDKPELIQKKGKELQDAKKRLDLALERLRPVVAKEVEREMLVGQVQKIQELQYKVEIQKRLLAQMDQRAEEERKEMESHGDERLSLKFAQDDLERSEEVHARIADRIVALKTEKLAPARANKQLAAKVPPEPVEKIPFAKLGVAGGGAFFLPFGLAFLWERLARRISHGDQLAADANVPVLGEIAMLPTRRAEGKTPSASYFRERVTFEESIDALRVTLMLLPESKDISALLVTSAVSAEGKTNLATSLAISLARATHEPLLIIDGDMRDPDVHEIFGVDLRPGLANVLDETYPLEAAIVKTQVENVDLLPAGRLKYSPHFLLRNGAFPSMLKEVRKKYRYVIVDSPPVLSASESVVLANACDGVLICTRCDYSRSPQLRAAKERLQNAGARVLGAVVSGVPTRSWAQRYGGYGYGWQRYAAAYHSFYAPGQRLLEQTEERSLDDDAIHGNEHA